MKSRNRIFSSGLTWLWISLLVIAIDRFSKFWVVNNLTYFSPIKILPIFNLTLTYNTGAAFSFLHSQSGWQNWLLGSIAVLVSLFMLGWLLKLTRKDYWMNIALTLIIGGALGNAWDRILYGYVIDFLSFHLGEWHFAIFNIADSAICVGAVMVILHWLNIEKKSFVSR